jgi:uncharacterized membrane protein
MIETHVVNALILPEYKLTLPHKILTFFNGLVAPTFLFCAGFAFAISARRKWADFTPASKMYWRYVVRLLFILVVGYSLHLPFFALSKLLALNDPSAWLPFYQADILQTIAVTLLFLAMLAALLRSEKVFYSAAALCFTLFVFAAPIVREADLSALPPWLTPYLTMNVKTQFPLFPWSGFLIGGMLVGAMFIRSVALEGGGVYMKRLVLASLGAIILSLAVESIPLTIYPNHDFWKGSPEFFFVRFGIVVVLLVLLWRFGEGRGEGGSSVLALFGQESLLVYVVHLLVVYGYDYKFSFIRMFGPTLGYLPVFGLFALLTAAMYGLAFGWHRIKRWNKTWARYLEYAVLAGIVLSFLLK